MVNGNGGSFVIFFLREECNCVWGLSVGNPESLVGEDRAFGGAGVQEFFLVGNRGSLVIFFFGGRNAQPCLCGSLLSGAGMFMSGNLGYLVVGSLGGECQPCLKFVKESRESRVFGSHPLP